MLNDEYETIFGLPGARLISVEDVPDSSIGVDGDRAWSKNGTDYKRVDGAWVAQSGSSGQTPVLFGVASQTPGAAMASFVNDGLGSMTPVATLFDGAPIGAGFGWIGLVSDGAGVLLAGTAPTDTTFIGHDLSLIYRSTDKGATWTGIVTPWDADIGENTQIAQIAFGPGNEVICYGIDAGSSNVFGYSNDKGQTWIDITADLPSGAAQIAWDGTNWFTIDSNETNGVYVTTTPLVLGSWTSHLTGIDGELVSYVVCTPTASIAFGGSGAVVMVVSTDHGTTWVDNTNPFDGVGQPLTLLADGAGHWLAWANASGGFNPPILVQSIDNGTSWGTPVELPAFATQVANAFLAGTGWITIWGSNVSVGASSPKAGAPGGVIVYSAPVAEPLVITPTAYAADNIYAPAGLVAV